MLLEGRLLTLQTRSSHETAELGRVIGERLKGGEIVLLEGPLGAGKTTMVQGIARGLGVEKPVSSPSFVLEKIYEGRSPLHHFDFYRLDLEDIEESGFLYDLDPEAVIVIEWADRLGGMLSDWTLRISIDFVSPSVHRGCFERAELRNVKIRVKDEGMANGIEQFIQRGKADGGKTGK